MPDPNDHVDPHWHLNEAWRQWLLLCEMKRKATTLAALKLIQRRQDKAADRIGLWIERIISDNHRTRTRDT